MAVFKRFKRWLQMRRICFCFLTAWLKSQHLKNLKVLKSIQLLNDFKTFSLNCDRRDKFQPVCKTDSHESSTLEKDFHRRESAFPQWLRKYFWFQRSLVQFHARGDWISETTVLWHQACESSTNEIYWLIYISKQRLAARSVRSILSPPTRKKNLWHPG